MDRVSHPHYLLQLCHKIKKLSPVLMIRII
uniref:Uncharacterized protein n=1 Tax=Ascaris lumbricoides TaxID=6252 RepID=A0A0M3HH23_ASCLU